MTSTTPDPESTTPSAQDAQTSDEDARDDTDVEGHLYGEYYKPQVEGRWAGRTRHAAGGDATNSPPRRTPRRKNS